MCEREFWTYKLYNLNYLLGRHFVNFYVIYIIIWPVFSGNDFLFIAKELSGGSAE